MRLCRDCTYNRPAIDMTQRPCCEKDHAAEVIQGYGCDDWDDGKAPKTVAKPKPVRRED